MEKSREKQWLLIALCWVVYTLAYIARYSYSANITPIMSEYSLDRSSAGLVSSFFFFAYGAGQVLNGIFCRKYNRRIVLPCALAVTCACNLIIFLGVPFNFYKLVWLVNGVAQSFFWTSIILTLGESLEEGMLPKATFLMSSTVAVGTLGAYGLSSIFTAIGAYKLIFLTGAVAMGVMAVVWFISFPLLAKKREREENATEKAQSTGKGLSAGVLTTVIMLALFAVINNFVKDGLTGWSPDILKSNYGFSDSTSILITLILPIVGFCFQALNVVVQKKIKNFVVLAGVWFGLAALFLTGATLLLGTENWPLLVICMALTSGFMLNVNNTITSMAPLYMRDSISPGLMAGVMDGFCYLGSTVGMVLLGATSDGLGWSGAFTLLAAISAVPAVITVIYLAVKGIADRKKRAESGVQGENY